MISAILKSAILDSAILNKKKTSLIHCDWTWWWQPSWILPSWIQQISTKLCLKLIHSHSTWWCQTPWILPCWIQPFWTKRNFTHSFWLNFMMVAILNSTILDSAILHKINFTHTLWLILMIAVILNSAMLDSDTVILDSDTLLSFLRFTQKHSHSTLTLTRTNSV